MWFQDLTTVNSGIATLPRKKPEKSKEKTFISAKRAQNCSILLTKLKMSNSEIRRTIITMDTENKIGKDMLEQVKNYIIILYSGGRERERERGRQRDLVVVFSVALCSFRSSSPRRRIVLFSMTTWKRLTSSLELIGSCWR